MLHGKMWSGQSSGIVRFCASIRGEIIGIGGGGLSMGIIEVESL